MYCWSAKISNGTARSGIQLSFKKAILETIGFNETNKCITDFPDKLEQLRNIKQDLHNYYVAELTRKGIEEAKHQEIKEFCLCEEEGCNGEKPEADSNSSNGETKVDAKKSIMVLITMMAIYFSN